MNIKFTKILSLLGQATMGSIIGVAGQYLISQKDLNAHLYKKQLLLEIHSFFDHLSKLIVESPIKNLLTEIQQTFPNEIIKIYKNNRGFEDGYLAWLDFWKKKVYSQELSLGINFRKSINDNINLASYDIVCEHNGKKYNFSMIFSKNNKVNYETTILWMMENIEPLIKQLDELIFTYLYN